MSWQPRCLIYLPATHSSFKFVVIHQQKVEWTPSYYSIICTGNYFILLLRKGAGDKRIRSLCMDAVCRYIGKLSTWMTASEECRFEGRACRGGYNNRNELAWVRQIIFLRLWIQHRFDKSLARNVIIRSIRLYLIRLLKDIFSLAAMYIRYQGLYNGVGLSCPSVTVLHHWLSLF
jgi:hypothetical protein